MIYIFDLDYTLLNATKLKLELSQIIGISFKTFNDSYKKYFSGKENYNFYKHLSYLIKDNIVKKDNSEKIRQNVKKYLNNINHLLIPGAEDLLKKVKESNHKIIMLSFGCLSWQKDKLNGLNIRKYFDKIILTEQNKRNALDFLRKNEEKKVIINDNARETLLLEEALGPCRVFLVSGPYSDNACHGYSIINLKDCIPYVQ